MSLRRSTRKTTEIVKSELKRSHDDIVIKTELQKTITTKVKKVKKEIKIEDEPLHQQPQEQQKAPKNWEIVYDTLEAYREINKAAVDTMGCERLADSKAPAHVQRFQTLVSLMLSAQTKDTVTSAAVIKLQNELKGGLCLESILSLDEAVLDDMIRSVGFHTKKASYIKRTAEILRDQYNGDIPDTIEGLTSLPGVGPKMGYLTLQVAWNKTSVLGISNRLGWVKTKTPEETRLSLQSWLPKDKWKKINPIMVGYGQIVCLPRGPLCNACPVSQYCPSAVIKKMKNKILTESIYFKKEEDTAPLDW
ncbi:DNA glycosylase [Mucor mucedo]|uniref:DNA glycosylase n=1 Tax=Mucor mucedo TaxID=29922 RepID=UPI002220779F|nr:DNA glycosylase [Mucor mucedo]KAI7892445.1 DNA glycosylase [Mucor mucedo]